MLFDHKRQALFRILTGAALGVAAHLLLGYLMGSFSLFGPSRFRGFMFPTCGFPYSIEWAGVLLSFALFALFGAEVGVATLPFAEEGRSLLLRSLLHFLLMCATVTLWAGLNFRWRADEVAYFLVPLILVYLLVWLGRWVGWYAEVVQLRERLGLTSGPSFLKWKETLPYFAFALVSCFALPALVWGIFDAMLGSLLNYLLLSAGCFCSGLSLGKRQGVCPLYPLFCGLALWPVVRGIYNIAPSVCLIPALFALVGDLTGALWRRTRREPHETDQSL